MLAKLVAHATATLVIMIGLQGLLGYLQLGLKTGAMLPVLPFVAALGLMSLNLLFYLTLTVMLGTLFQSRGPVIGIAAGLLIGGEITGQLLGRVAPWLPPLLPQRLEALATAVAREGFTSSLPEQWLVTILVVTAYAVAAVVVALWRFGREEF